METPSTTQLARDYNAANDLAYQAQQKLLTMEGEVKAQSLKWEAAFKEQRKLIGPAKNDPAYQEFKKLINLKRATKVQLMKWTRQHRIAQDLFIALLESREEPRRGR